MQNRINTIFIQVLMLIHVFSEQRAQQEYSYKRFVLNHRNELRYFCNKI